MDPESNWMNSEKKIPLELLNAKIWIQFLASDVLRYMFPQAASLSISQYFFLVAFCQISLVIC